MPSGTPITDYQKQRILKLKKEGVSSVNISESMNLSREVINKVIRESKNKLYLIKGE